jgi:hypothetical protein
MRQVIEPVTWNVRDIRKDYRANLSIYDLMDSSLASRIEHREGRFSIPAREVGLSGFRSVALITASSNFAGWAVARQIMGELQA